VYVTCSSFLLWQVLTKNYASKAKGMMDGERKSDNNS